jgi:hypothetical protein
MIDHRFDTLARRLDTVHTRRCTLGAGIVALTMLDLAGRNDEITAKKKRRKKHKKKKAQPASCAELCGPECALCFYRADAPPLCGNLGMALCPSEPCGSDNDCVGSINAYCVTKFEDRVTADVTTFCDGAPTCVQVFACSP